MASITVNGRTWKLAFNMGVWEDLEESGVNPQELLQEIQQGKTGALNYLTLCMIRGAAEHPEQIPADLVRKFPPSARADMMMACVEAFTEGMRIEGSDDAVRDPTLEEIEKKEAPDA